MGHAVAHVLDLCARNESEIGWAVGGAGALICNKDSHARIAQSRARASSLDMRMRSRVESCMRVECKVVEGTSHYVEQHLRSTSNWTICRPSSRVLALVVFFRDTIGRRAVVGGELGGLMRNSPWLAGL